MQRPISLALLVALFLPFFTPQACLGENSPASGGSLPLIKVGATLALTGKISPVGGSERDGLLLAFEDLAHRDGPEVRLLAEDNGGDPKSAVGGVRKLLDIDHIDILIAAFTHITQAVKGSAARAKIPFLYISTVKSIVAEEPLFFRDYWDIDAAALATAAAAHRRGYKNVAYIREEGDSCTEHEAAFTGEAKRLGIETVFRNDFISGTTDFRALLLKAKLAAPQAIVFCAFRDAGTVMRQLAELGMLGIPALHLEAPFLDTSDTPEMRQLYEENRSISSWYGYVEGSMSPAVSRFVSRFQQRFGYTPKPDALFAYDTATAVIEAARSCVPNSRFDSACFAKYLSEHTFQGVASEFSFGSGRSTSRPVLMMEVKSGKWVDLHD